MADFLLSPVLYTALCLCAVLFAVIMIRRPGLLWSILSSLSTIAACLLGLAAGRSLEQLLTAILIPTAVILLSQVDSEGSGSA